MEPKPLPKSKRNQDKPCYSCGLNPRIPSRANCYSCYFEKSRGWKNAVKKRLDYTIHDLSDEIWVDVPGFENLYSVSNMGRVKSLKRTVAHSRSETHSIKEKLITPVNEGNTGNNYKAVVLYRNSKKDRFKVHRLVMLTFVGKSDLLVDHINGDRTDNRLCNLRYCTHRQNTHFYREKQDVSSRHVGVSWNSQTSKWSSKIRINNRSFHLGNYENEADACRAFRGALRIAEIYEKNNLRVTH